jgi:hypothetical protein
MVEVNQPHPHARYRRGKSDPLDAELAARAALSGAASAIPKHSGGIVEAIRQLALARVVADPPACPLTAKVGELLLVVPRIGPARADRALARCRIAHAKTVGGWRQSVALHQKATWSPSMPVLRGVSAARWCRVYAFASTPTWGRTPSCWRSEAESK